VTAAKQLYSELKHDIVTCALAPGQSLSECELAACYKTSRTPVREVCRHLANEGFITIIPFRGYFVSPLTVSEFKNLQEVQLIVDPAGAELAAGRAGQPQIADLERWARYRYKRGDVESYYEFLDQNRRLHTRIAEAAGNRHLVEIVSNVHTRLMRYFFLGLDAASFGVEISTEHCGIVDAIRKRKPHEARKLAREHILSTIRRSSGLLAAGLDSRGIEFGLLNGSNGLPRPPSPRSARVVLEKVSRKRPVSQVSTQRRNG
jgi:GntR family transcriptional regulator, rspAB operon transcriptional repressor